MRKKHRIGFSTAFISKYSSPGFIDDLAYTDVKVSNHFNCLFVASESKCVYVSNLETRLIMFHFTLPEVNCLYVEEYEPGYGALDDSLFVSASSCIIKYSVSKLLKKGADKERSSQDEENLDVSDCEIWKITPTGCFYGMVSRYEKTNVNTKAERLLYVCDYHVIAGRILVINSENGNILKEISPPDFSPCGIDFDVYDNLVVSQNSTIIMILRKEANGDWKMRNELQFDASLVGLVCDRVNNRIIACSHSKNTVVVLDENGNAIKTFKEIMDPYDLCLDYRTGDLIVAFQHKLVIFE